MQKDENYDIKKIKTKFLNYNFQQKINLSTLF